MRRNRIIQLGMSALLSVWIAASLSVTAIRTLDAVCPVGLVAITCACAAAFGVLVSINRITAAIAGVSAAGAGVYLTLTNLTRIREFMLALRQGGLNGDMWAPLLLTLAALWTLFIFATTHTRSAGFLGMSFTLLYWLLIRSMAGPLDRLSMFATLIGVAALFAVPVNGRADYLKALLPTALISAFLAMALLPAEGTTYAPLANAAERVRSMFDAYFSFTDTRIPYSLYMDGYQPLGESLGGPADPHQWPIMRVSTESDLYLRGSIRRTYVNTAWTDATANSRYLFGDVMKQAVRDEIFETKRIDPEESGGAFEKVSAKVTMLNEGTSTLFVPHRLGELTTPVELAVYYNSVGEVFITRNVEDQDAYSLTAVVPTWDREALKAYIEARRNDEDPYYQQAARDFMQIPSRIESGVYVIVNDLTSGAMTPYQRAVAIEEYLQKNFEYTLKPDNPRRDIDFVSDFLLNTKRGYCSYFASAMAVMGRIAGLPARYVEGYRVEATPFGDTIVTGEDAHAWVEIYFNGVGWVTFDPTPGSGFSDSGSDGSEGDSRGADGEDGETDDPFDGNAAEPTPEPEEMPDDGESDVTPEPTDEPGSEETELGAEDEATPPPEDGATPPPEEGETPPPDIPPDTPPESDSNRRSWMIALLIVLGILLLLALLAAACWLRLQASDPAALAALHRKDAALQAMIYYRAILTLLESLGQVPESGETPLAFARRLARMAIADQKLVDFSGRISYAQYAGKGVTAEDVKLGRAAYLQLAGQLRLRERLRWYAERLRRGLGSVEQIP